MTGTDLHGAYLGAYTIDGHGGIDAGVVYSRKGSNDPGQWQDQILRGGSPPVYGSFFPCGQGKYSSTFRIAKSGAEVNQWELQTNTSPVILFEVPSTTFLLDGSNFIFRRLTGIGQSGNNFTSGEWFGFPGNDHDGPNLSEPDIAYQDTYACCNGTNLVQFVRQPNPNAYADRNPKVFNNVTGTLCGQDPYWTYPDNFADYEGVNLSNPNATGTFPAPNCNGN